MIHLNIPVTKARNKYIAAALLRNGAGKHKCKKRESKRTHYE